MTVTPAIRRAVFERDNWVCQLCCKPIPPNTAPTDPDGATIDHIRPIAAGRDDDPTNLQTAHRRCNLNKGTSDGLRSANAHPHRVPLALTPEQYERLKRLRFDTDAAGAELLRLAFDNISDDKLVKLAKGRTRNRRQNR